ncbi:MAG: lipopolysaccharide biosynthesis protein [Vicinamibacterales bacterium]
MSGASSFDARRVMARNTVWNYASAAASILVNLLLFRYVVSHIGEARAGIWLLLSSLTGYLGLLQLGTVPAVMRFAAAHHARGEHDEVSRLVSTTLALLAVLGGVPLLLLPMLPALTVAVGVPPDLAPEAETAFAIGLLSFAASMPGHAFNALLSAVHRQDRCSQVWILSLALKSAGAALVLGSGRGLLALVTMELVLVVLVDAVLAALAFGAVPDLSIAARLVNRPDLRRLTALGGLLFVSQICSLVIEQTDRFVVSAFLSLSMVTYYSAAWKIYMLGNIAPTVLLYSFPPVAAALAGRGELDDLRRLVFRLTKFAGAITLPVAGILGFGAGPVLAWWMGENFAGQAPVVQILLAGLTVTALNHAGVAALIGLDRLGPLVWLYALPQAVANLLLSLLLVRPLGLAGVALGTVVPAIALQPVFLHVLMRELAIDWRAWRLHVLRPLLGPALCFAPAFATAATIDASSPVQLLVACGCAAAALGTFFGLSLSSAERVDLLAMLRRRAPAV